MTGLGTRERTALLAAIRSATLAMKAGALSPGEGTSGYGFPVPASLRDLLVGDDARFF